MVSIVGRWWNHVLLVDYNPLPRSKNTCDHVRVLRLGFILTSPYFGVDFFQVPTPLSAPRTYPAHF